MNYLEWLSIPSCQFLASIRTITKMLEWISIPTPIYLNQYFVDTLRLFLDLISSCLVFKDKKSCSLYLSSNWSHKKYDFFLERFFSYVYIFSLYLSPCNPDIYKIEHMMTLLTYSLSESISICFSMTSYLSVSGSSPIS